MTPTLRRTLGLALAAVGISVTIACSADDPAPPPWSRRAAPATAPATTTAADRKSGDLKLGDKKTVTKEGYTVEVAALKVKRGDDYEGVQVRTCNKGAAEVSVSRLPWVLGYDGFEQLHDIDTSGGGLPAPAYPDRDLSQGECAKGWVNFTSVPGAAPDGIQYQPEGAEPVRWSF